MGLNLIYCLGWLHQEHNQLLSCPPHIARHLPQGVQELLGYTMVNYALGYYSDLDLGLEKNAGVLSPERAQGATPATDNTLTNEPPTRPECSLFESRVRMY